MPYNSDITINKGLTNKIFMVLCIFLLFIFQNVISSLYQYQYHWNLHFCLFKWTFYWESFFFSISVSSIQRVNHKYTSCAESYSTGLILSLIFMYQNQKISSFASLKVNWGTLQWVTTEGCWKDGSVVINTGCSLTAPRFRSQHLDWWLTTICNYSSKWSNCLFWHLWIHAQTWYTGQQGTHTY